MKKTVSQLLYLLVLIASLFTLSGCSKDSSDGDDGGSSTSSFVGKWEGTLTINGQTRNVTIEFKSTGKGTHSIYGQFSYSVNEDEETLTTVGSRGGKDVYYYEFKSGKKKLFLENEDSNKDDYYSLTRIEDEKVDPTYTPDGNDSIYGTWVYHHSNSEYEILALDSSGNGVIADYENDEIVNYVYFTFTYKNSILTMQINGEVMKRKVFSVNASTLVIEDTEGIKMTFTRLQESYE